MISARYLFFGENLLKLGLFEDDRILNTYIKEIHEKIGEFI